jgi:Domain of unknown function (DUF4190)
MASPPQEPGPGRFGSMPPYQGGYGTPQPKQPSKAPMVLSIIGIVCWFLFSPAAIVLGLVAQNQYRKQGQRDTLAKVAWIGGIVVLALGIILVVTHHQPAHNG